jgi:phosphocarrier protein HPr
MSSASIDHEQTVHISNKLGLHARPAAEFVKRAGKYQSDIVVRKDELEVNGKSIMGMMMLAAEYGSAITIRASGDDSAVAVQDLVSLVNGRFGEE